MHQRLADSLPLSGRDNADRFQAERWGSIRCRAAAVAASVSRVAPERCRQRQTRRGHGLRRAEILSNLAPDDHGPSGAAHLDSVRVAPPMRCEPTAPARLVGGARQLLRAEDDSRWRRSRHGAQPYPLRAPRTDCLGCSPNRVRAQLLEPRKGRTADQEHDVTADRLASRHPDDNGLARRKVAISEHLRKAHPAVAPLDRRRPTPNWAVLRSNAADPDRPSGTYG